MSKKGPTPTYTFINPNDRKTVESLLKQILTKKLLELYREWGPEL